MMHTPQALYDELRATLVQVDKQIQTYSDKVKSETWWDLEAGEVKHRDPFFQIDKNGRPVLTDLIAARAQVISAMAALKAAEMQKSGRPPAAGRKW